MTASTETIPAEGVLGCETAGADSAPASGWRRLVSDCLLVSGVGLVCQALGTVTAVGLRMVLSPAQMGVWQTVKMLLGYVNYANLGASKGAARQWAIARGQGNPQAAETGLHVAFTVNTLSSVIYAGVVLLVGLAAVWNGGDGSAEWIGGLAVAAFLAALQRHVTFHITLLRTAQQFGTTSRLALLEAGLTLLVAVWAARQFGLWGLYGATMLVMLAAWGYVEHYRVVRLQWAWNGQEVRRLVKIGMPILLSGLIHGLLRSVDKWTILTLLPEGTAQLGCYSAAVMVFAALEGLGNSMATVFLPRYGEKYGQVGRRREAARLAARSSELQAGLTAIAALAAWWVGRPVLGWLLPAYRPGLEALRWLLPGAMALCLALPASQYLAAVELEKRALGGAIGGMVLVGGATVTAALCFGNLEAVAWAACCGYLGYFLLLAVLSYWQELTWPERRRWAAVHGLIFGMVLLLCGALPGGLR
ncbi:MAG TPA: lipopolysaccharide biosynthesis protein [Thermoguttaceae bacterium]|nr:lipopolysaccharide biosynthesis protein [Thermoguttaceae bacterium]